MNNKPISLDLFHVKQSLLLMLINHKELLNRNDNINMPIKFFRYLNNLLFHFYQIIYHIFHFPLYEKILNQIFSHKHIILILLQFN